MASGMVEMQHVAASLLPAAGPWPGFPENKPTSKAESPEKSLATGPLPSGEGSAEKPSAQVPGAREWERSQNWPAASQNLGQGMKLAEPPAATSAPVQPDVPIELAAAAEPAIAQQPAMARKDTPPTSPAGSDGHSESTDVASNAATSQTAAPDAGRSRQTLEVGGLSKESTSEPAPKANQPASEADRDSNATPQKAAQGALANAQPAARGQAKDAHGNSSGGDLNSITGGRTEAMQISGGSLQPWSERLATEAAHEQEQSDVTTKEILPESGGASFARPAVAREISLQLDGTAGVAIQVSERAGKIDVAVRTGDSQLSKSLQSGLGELVTQLENHGFKTDAWTPAAARAAGVVHSTSEPSSSHQQQSGNSGAWSSRQERQGDSNPRRQPRARAAFERTLAEEDARTE